MQPVSRDLSIVIVSYNTKDLLHQCLRAVYENLGNLDVEVFVVDNDSKDGSPEMVKEEFPQVILIENKDNRGFAAANNQAIRESKGQYVLLLNSDTEILDNALEKTLRFAEKHPDAWGIGCKILNSDSTIQFSQIPLSSLDRLIATNTPYPIYKPFRIIYPDPVKNPKNYERTKETGALLGAFILMKREAIEEIGMLDELFFMYAEEVDWCYRVHKARKKIIYFADAEIIHHRNQSAKKVAVRTFIQRKKSMILFFKKNHPELTFLAKSYILLCLILNIPFSVLRFLIRKDKSFNGNHYFAAVSWMLKKGLKI